MSSQKTKAQALELFEFLADEYADERENMPLYRPQLEFMMSALAREKGLVLDIGCAAGSEIRSLRKNGFRVIGVDFSPAMLERGQRRFRGQPEVLFCLGDAERLPFRSGSIDHVVCFGLLEYLPTYNLALAEIHRVLRNGGLAVLTIPTRMSLFMLGQRAARVVAPLWRALKRFVRPQGKPRPLIPSHRRNLCVPWRFRQLLRRRDFKTERSAYSAYTVYPLDRFPALNLRVAGLLQPLCSVPVVRSFSSVYMVSARKVGDF